MAQEDLLERLHDALVRHTPSPVCQLNLRRWGAAGAGVPWWEADPHHTERCVLCSILEARAEGEGGPCAWVAECMGPVAEGVADRWLGRREQARQVVRPTLRWRAPAGLALAALVLIVAGLRVLDDPRSPGGRTRGGGEDGPPPTTAPNPVVVDYELDGRTGLLRGPTRLPGMPVTLGLVGVSASKVWMVGWVAGERRYGSFVPRPPQDVARLSPTAGDTAVVVLISDPADAEAAWSRWLVGEDPAPALVVLLPLTSVLPQESP